MQALQSTLGVVAIIAIAFLISENRRAVPWRPVITGLALTFVLALLMLKIPQTEIAFGWINRAVEAVAAATRAGTAFVFGYVGGGALPFDPKTPGSDFILAFQALPVVLVMSVLSSLLFYWRILPPIVRGFSWALERTLDVGGAAGLSTAANIFVVTLQRTLGWIMAPVCWLMGIPWSQAVTAGGLMGIKTILNELVAYLQLAALPDGALDPRSRLIMLYAMCGFANFGSLGIMIAGLSTMCPAKRNEVVSLGLKSIVSGTLTTCFLGAIVGLLT